MRPRLSLSIGAALCAASVAACGSSASSPEPSPSASIPAALTDRDADGTALANAWVDLVSASGSGTGTAAPSAGSEKAEALVRPYLDPAFQLQRASGERYTADSYVPSDIRQFEVSDVVVTEPSDDVRVVRYGLSTAGAVLPDSGMVMSDEVAPRLTVFKWDEGAGHWDVVSHANFNSPVAAVCGVTPVQVESAQPDTSAEDVAIGESLVAQWRDITTGASKENVLNPQAQIQLADGQGWPNPDGSQIKWTPAKAYDYANLAVTRDGNLLVATYDAVVSDLVMEGAEYREQATPRLLTYMQNDAGTWELIGLANFTVPQGVPAGVDCKNVGQ